AMNIHKEASKIFSFGVTNDCNEMSLRKARSTKKLEIIRLVFPNVVGNKIRKLKKKRNGKVLSLLSPFFFVMKFEMKSEATNNNNSTPFVASSMPEFTVVMSFNW